MVAGWCCGALPNHVRAVTTAKLRCCCYCCTPPPPTPPLRHYCCGCFCYEAKQLNSQQLISIEISVLCASVRLQRPPAECRHSTYATIRTATHPHALSLSLALVLSLSLSLCLSLSVHVCVSTYIYRHEDIHIRTHTHINGHKGRN